MFENAVEIEKRRRFLRCVIRLRFVGLFDSPHGITTTAN